MSKTKETLEKFEENLDIEAHKLEESILSFKEDIRESVENFIKLEEIKEEYAKLYTSKLIEACDKSQKELDDETKEKLDKDMEESWKGEKLDDSIIESIKLEAQAAVFKSDDPRESEEDANKNTNTKVEDPNTVDPGEDTTEPKEVDKQSEKENDDAAPEDPKVDDQTDVKITKVK